MPAMPTIKVFSIVLILLVRAATIHLLALAIYSIHLGLELSNFKNLQIPICKLPSLHRVTLTLVLQPHGNISFKLQLKVLILVHPAQSAMLLWKSVHQPLQVRATTTLFLWINFYAMVTTSD